MDIKRFTVSDSRGKESKTLAFVTVGFAAILFRFLISGHFGFSEVGVIEFGASFTAVLAPWLGREWMEKRSG